jgi:hypothetical protein
MTIGTCLRMEVTPSRDINSSFGSATGVSGTTGLKLQTACRGGTMRALRKLVQSGGPHAQDKDDADRRGRENDQNPICKTDHGCTCLVESSTYSPIAPTVAAIPDMNLTPQINGRVNGIACPPCAFW